MSSPSLCIICIRSLPLVFCGPTCSYLRVICFCLFSSRFILCKYFLSSADMYYSSARICVKRAFPCIPLYMMCTYLLSVLVHDRTGVCISATLAVLVCLRALCARLCAGMAVFRRPSDEPHVSNVLLYAIAALIQSSSAHDAHAHRKPCAFLSALATLLHSAHKM